MKHSTSRLIGALILSVALFFGTSAWSFAQGGGATATLQRAMIVILGEVTASPTANTVLGRLDIIEDKVVALLSESAGDYAAVRLVNSGATDFVSFGALTPCQTGTWVKTNINVAATARTLVFESTGATKAYICGGWISSHAANVLSIVEDTDADNCNSSEAALAGSTTDTEGSVVFAANGGINYFGAAVGQVMVTSATGKDICFDATTADRLVGVLWIVEGT